MKQLQEQHPGNPVEAELGWSGYPVYKNALASRIYFVFFAFCLIAIVMPRSCKTLKRPPRRPNSSCKNKEPLFSLKLELSISPMQWQRAERVQPRWGRIFITVDVGGEGISRVQDPDWLVFIWGYLGKKG